MNIIDCKSISNQLREKIAEAIASTGKTPILGVILVGDNPASQIYVRNKEKACATVGIDCRVARLPQDTTTTAVINEVREFVDTPGICGIMVQLPLAPQIDERAVLDAIPLWLDVDGLTISNMGSLATGQKAFTPCTVRGIIEILLRTTVIEGKNVVIIGRSNIVGKPLALALTSLNATCTLCHSHTENLAELTRQADIIVCSVGKPHFLTADMVSPQSIVIDVGINRLADGKVVGDADFDAIKDKIAAITPVPGGVGVMTVTSLLNNVVDNLF